jgi:hypothetical protein
MFPRIRRHLTFRTVVAFMAVASLTIGVGAASAASPTWLCVPEETGKPVTSGGSEGKCEAKNTKVELPPTAELATLNKILPHVAYAAEGIDKKPTIQFSGTNVQIINGEGKTATINGEGNLIIGYDENSAKREQTGSHDLILGEDQGSTSYGAILAGANNSVTKPFGSVTGGADNTVSALGASVGGGTENKASGEFASVSGGDSGTASAQRASVSGGIGGTASADYASVSGGWKNAASENYASVSGGANNKARGDDASVSGGEDNEAAGEGASVLGGGKNLAEGFSSAIYGGKELKTTKEYEAIG